MRVYNVDNHLSFTGESSALLRWWRSVLSLLPTTTNRSAAAFVGTEPFLSDVNERADMDGGLLDILQLVAVCLRSARGSELLLSPSAYVNVLPF